MDQELDANAEPEKAFNKSVNDENQNTGANDLPEDEIDEENDACFALKLCKTT